MDSDFKDIERIMDVDFWGVVNGTKAFLPHVIASGDGHIVNISSMFGLIAVPGQSAYNAAKFAVHTFAEFLDNYLALHSPEMVAATIVDGVRDGRARVVTGWEAKALDVLSVESVDSDLQVAESLGPEVVRPISVLVQKTVAEVAGAGS